MKYAAGLLVGLLWAGSLRAANPSLDTLITRLARLKTEPASRHRDTSLVLTVSLLTERLFNQNDPRAERYLDSLHRLMLALHWNKTEGLYWRARGKQNDVRGHYAAALDHYQRAIKLLTQAGGDPFELAYTHVLTAFVLQNNGLLSACRAELSRALPLARATRNTNNLCWIYDFFGDYNYYPNYGIRNYRRALYYYQQVEKLLPRATSPNLRADNPHCLANVYQQLGDTARASAYRQQALHIARQNNNRVVIFAIYADLAAWAEDHHSYPMAIHAEQQSLAFAEQSGWKEMQARAENALYKTYKKAGDPVRALQMLERYQQHEDSLGRLALQQKYDELQARYATEARQVQLKTLQNQSLGRTRNLLLLVLLVSMLLVGFIVWSNRMLRRKNRQLAGKNREVSAALERGQSLERQRVATELHDNLNTKLAALRWRLEAAGADPDTIGMLSDLYTDVRLIAHNLLPTELTNGGLPMALKTLTDHLNQTGRSQFTVQTQALTTPLPAHYEHELYCVALELIQNTLRHARANTTVIRLEQRDSHLFLSVSDNGIGFGSEGGKQGSGAGLLSVRHRIAGLSGRLSIASQPGSGTRVEVAIPLG